MTETPLPPRFHLSAGPAQAAGLLPMFGRVLVGLARGAITHERLGPVARVDLRDGWVTLGGEAHDAALLESAVARVVADRTGRMRDRVLPRLEFQDAEGAVLLSATALEGAEAFDAALADWVAEPAPPRPVPDAAQAPAPDDMAEDAATLALEALRDSGGEVEIAMVTRAARQSWRGRVEAVRPAMGFANIIRPDFHLHLRMGSLGGFRPAGAGREVLDTDGLPTGLTLSVLPPAC